MASPRYTLNIKPEDLLPDAPAPEMTAKEKRENFWFYHKWHVVLGAVAAVLLASFVWELASKVEPDYTIALLSARVLPVGIGEALGEQLAPFADDRNGDGRVVVSVMEYGIYQDDGAASDPNLLMANMTKLMADVDMGESILFLTDDVEGFEEQYGFFAYNDGSTPEEGVRPDYARMGVRWGDCPALAALELGESQGFGEAPGIDYQAFLQDYQWVPRQFTGTKLEKSEEGARYFEDSMALLGVLAQR